MLSNIGITNKPTNEEVINNIVQENLNLAQRLTGQRSKRRLNIAQKIQLGFENYRKRNREGD